MRDAHTTLVTLLDVSGLTVSAFARDVVGRDVRTVRRWLNQHGPIPASVAQWLARATIERNAIALYVRIARPVHHPNDP